MILEKIFEDDLFIIYEDKKGFDFTYDIENKTDRNITILLEENEEEITIKEWLGLFSNEYYIVEDIINGRYKEIRR